MVFCLVVTNYITSGCYHEYGVDPERGGLRKGGDYVEVGFDSDNNYNQSVRDDGLAGWLGDGTVS